MRTSPPRTFDIEATYPRLARFRRTATRLHPRPGDPGVRDSSVGGPLLWPADEPWPVCDADDHYDSPTSTVLNTRRSRLLVALRDQARKRGEDTAGIEARLREVWDADKAIRETAGAGEVARPQPLIGVAQLYVRDVPDLRRPEGADLLQVLWCPYAHEGAEYLPTVRLVWRDSASVTDTVPDPSPDVVVGDDGYVPEMCVVHPEAVTEYPPTGCWGVTLPDDDVDYVDSEALASGWKVGGWGDYCGVTDPVVPECGCGAPTEAFFTVGNGEWSTDFGSWRPIEDADFTPTPRHPTGWDPVRTYIGRGYVMQLFQCVKGFDCPPVTLMT